MAHEFKFGVGLDPDLHIAGEQTALNETTTMLFLDRIAEANGLKTKIVAKLLPPSGNADGATVGADMLRDCYAKIDALFLPASAAPAAGTVKVIKALRSKAHITAVRAKNGEGTACFPETLPDGFPLAQLDETVAVGMEDAEAFRTAAAALEGLAVDLPSAAALCAAVEAAKRAKDARARTVVLLTYEAGR